MNRIFSQRLFFHIAMFSFLIAAYVPAAAGDQPKPGDKLPEFALNAPASSAELSYLGLAKTPTFEFDQLGADLVVMEIIGVYCPKCHLQYPKMKKLFHQVQKDRALAAKVKFLSIAIGANPAEVAFLRKQFQLPYPVTTDPLFEIHKKLGEPRTPFTMLVTKDGKIVYAHLGLIENFDKFLAEIRKQAG